MNDIPQDSIKREITVKASGERVYNAITDPKQVVTWFPDVVEGSLVEGERVLFGFGESETFKVPVYIVAAKPYTYFAYRWVPGSDVKEVKDDVLTVPNTLVEFYIEEIVDGTKVTLIESGFASLPSEIIEEKLKENTEGWDFMIDRLEKLLAQD